MDNQYYYKLMASYLSKRNCDESFMRYFFGKNSLKKTSEELEKADERKRRLQRERSRRYRALKNARRQHEAGSRDSVDGDGARCRSRGLLMEEEFSDGDEPPTLCDLVFDDKWRESGPPSSDCASDDNSAHSAAELKEASNSNVNISLKEFLSSPNAELDYQTVHSLMFHWLQT